MTTSRKKMKLSMGFFLTIFFIAGFSYFLLFTFLNHSSADQFLIVTSFVVPSSASSTTISITNFTATDDVAVTGYLINESSTIPLLSDPKWETTATTTYTFTLTGARTLYAWVKDGDNNISDYASSSVLVDTSNPVVTNFNIPAISSSTTISINSFEAEDAYNWAAVGPAGNDLTYWYSADMTPDASVILAGFKNGRLYISTTTGATWTEVRPAGDFNLGWYTAALSDDGSVMIAGYKPGRLYISTTTGAIWKEVRPAGNVNKDWWTTAMSADGSVIMAGSYNETGRLYMSTDTGKTWVELKLAGDINNGWIVSEVSDNGSVMLAGAYPGRLYMSINTGVTWNEVRPAGDVNENWWTSAMSGDGSTVVAGYNDGRLYMSANTGVTWNEVRPAGDVDKNWRTSSMSTNGSIIIAGTANEGIYHSVDAGATWKEIRPTPKVDNYWRTSAMSADGSIITVSGDEIGKSFYIGHINNTGISGYLVTESRSIPSLSNSAWKTTPDTTYTFTSAGEKTLYAWTRDFVGNIGSSSAEISINTTAPTITAFNIPASTTSATINSVELTATDDTSKYTISETQPDGSVDKTWWTSAISNDGANIIAGAYPGRLYHSVNSGATWVETQPAGAVDKSWGASAMSSDGTNIIAGAYNGRLYRSTTSGATWVETQPAGAVDYGWWNSSMSDDGKNIIACSYSGRLYRSTSSGATWVETQPAGAVNKDWVASAMSSDGKNIIVASYFGRLYRSTTSGATWVETQPAGAVDNGWMTSAMSADGKNIIVGAYPGRLYRSTSSGATWVETQPAGAVDKDWWASTMSADGKNVIAGVSYGSLYRSTTSGATWVEIQPIGEASNYWGFPVMSADGFTTLITTVVSGRLYIMNNFYISYLINESASIPALFDSNWKAKILTTYHFLTDGVKTLFAWAKDHYGNISTSLSKMIIVDTTAPIVSGISTLTTISTSTITWTTNENASSTIYYGTSTDYGQKVSSDIFTTYQSLIISGLESVTTYNYMIETMDQYGNTSTTSNRTFQTLGICPTLPNATLYNPYPTCGAAACANSYRVFNGECSIQGSSGGGGTTIAPLSTKPITVISEQDNSTSSVSNDSNSSSETNGAPSTSWKTGESDNWGKEITCSLENLSPSANEQRRLEKEDMAKKIEAIIVKQKNETPSQKLKRLDLEKRLSGRVLLQVEEKGEAWYLDPVSKKRFFLGRPTDMYNVMEKLGLGATHKYISETNTFPNRLLGRILIDVGDGGRAYYINPMDKKKYYLACPSNAFNVIRKLGLGITNANLDYIKAGEY